MLDDSAIKKLEESSGHSVFGPSSLPRIVKCPGSVNECLKVPPKPSSIYAEHGTMLHDIVEKELNHIPCDYDKLSIVDASYVMDCLNWVETLKEKHTGEIYMGVEQKVTLSSFGLPEIYGTADSVIASADRIDITDWKFGSGVPRYAKGCQQSLAYAAGAVGFDDELENIKVFIHIVQPPLRIFDTIELTYREMVSAVETIRTAVVLAKKENPPRLAGLSQCRFCAANMTCSERHNATKRDAAAVFNAMSAPTIISDEAISMLLTKATAIQQYIKDAQKYASDRIRGGYGFPGFKLVPGRSQRKWKDAKAAEKFLMEQGFADEQLHKKKFVSPAQAEKLNKETKEAIVDLWEKPDGKPMIVSEDDKRPALQFNDGSVFIN